MSAMSTSPDPDPDAGPGALPGVSLVMAVLDEQAHLAEAVGHALDQDYGGELELVLALGPSRDRTDQIAAGLAHADPRVRTVPNPSGRTAAGLNAAIGASRHPVVVRVDGHSVIPPDYVRAAVETLAATGADNVGGVMAAEGTTAFERAVAAAMTSRLGVGAAPFHVGGQEGEAPTVYLGAFRRAALERVGGYDERFTRAQDWEMNHRIRQAGGLVWFTPRMRVSYRPRSTVRRLARQYLEYGRWRRQIVREHPQTLTVRYLAAPVALIAVAAGTLAGLVAEGGGPRVLRAGWLAPAGYAALLVAGTLGARGLDGPARRRLPLVLATMHGAWGAGFLTSPPGLLPDGQR